LSVSGKNAHLVHGGGKERDLPDRWRNLLPLLRVRWRWKQALQPQSGDGLEECVKHGGTVSCFGLSGKAGFFFPNTLSQASRAAWWFWIRLLDPLWLMVVQVL
jgi:hypothetical protein